MLAFAPQESIIQQACKKEVPTWMSLCLEPEDDWSPCLRVLEGHSGWVNSVAFSPDAALVASASDDRTVRLWRPETGECLQVLKGHFGSVNSVAFSPDAALVGSASADCTVRLWRAETGECIQREEVGTVTSQLAFNLEGSRLLTSDGAIGIRRPQVPVTAISGAPGHQSMATCDSTRYIGSGFSRDQSWVTWNGKNLLWLPAEFRPRCSAASGSAVAVGCASGRVIMMGFLAEEFV